MEPTLSPTAAAREGAPPAPSGPSLPPGPAIGRFAQAVRFHRDPLGFLAAQRRELGDVFTLRLAVTGTVVMFTSRADTSAVVGADPTPGHAGEARRRIVQLISPRSILGADGGEHAAARRRLAPAFAPGRLSALGDAMTAIADRHVQSWSRGRPFRLLSRMRVLCDEIFVRLVLGVDDERRVAELVGAIGRMLWTPGNPPFSPPGQGSGLAGAVGEAVFARRRRPVDRLLTEEIEQRRREGRAGQGDDLVDCLLLGEPDADPARVADELIPVLMAGQEPPGAALTWLLDRLAREHDHAAWFLRATPDDPLRSAIVRETFRLRPAVHSVARRLTETAHLGRQVLPAGTTAAAPIVLLHRDPDAFPEPDRFRPERFLDGGAEGAPYLPFGGGARRCLGEALAQVEIDRVVPEILRRVRLEPVWRRPERMVVRGTVLVPHRSGLTVARSV